MTHGRCVVWGGGGGYLHAHTWIFFFPASSQRVSETAHAARVALLLYAKIRVRLEQRYCIKFCQKLGDSQVETIGKIQRVFGDDATVRSISGMPLYEWTTAWPPCSA
jgi:hypothetical protein